MTEISYKIELSQVPDNYLSERVRYVFERKSGQSWDNHISSGYLRPINWSLARKILAYDDVYFSGSRMIEILVGYYIHEAGHSLAAKWRPSAERPGYAAAVYQASVVSWRSQSVAARRQKARHFRRVLAKAEGQLPSDRPGVIHIGIESSSGSNVDLTRHFFNSLEARLFKIKDSRLRWIYGNYFVPEATTRRSEGWAITETMVPYKVGKHQTRWPLPGHMLVSPEVEGEPGTHWDKIPAVRA